MSNPVKPIPEGYHTITPSLICRGADGAIDFYKGVLGAKELLRMPNPNGKIGHAELKIGDSIIFVNDEFPQAGATASASPGAQAIYLFLYVEDVDTVFNRAVAAGACVDMPVQDMFWGDRYGKLTDPFGHPWGIATHKEDVAPEEIDRRSEAFFKKAAGQG